MHAYHDGNYNSTLNPTFTVVPISDTTYYGFTISGNNRFLLGNYTVTHNTAMSIYIASKISLKTLVLCNRVVLINQWKESISRFCPNSTVSVINPKSPLKDTDFYIANAINIPKKSRDEYKDIGFLIVDEAHLIMAKKLSESMKLILPKYILGLSATPYRHDDLNVLMDFYFGSEKIQRKLYRQHTVYKVNTLIKPETKLNQCGKVDWNHIIDFISNHESRNEMIIKIVKHFTTKTFLILCKRVSQAEYLISRFKEMGESVTSLIRSQQSYEKDSRILIGTAQKVGTGFDHPKLDSLILACDVEQYFIQYLGRVFRVKDSVPTIFDLVDNHGILIKHYKTRQSIYLEHGGSIKDFRREFPDLI